jgi:hypothetical protein
MVDVLKQGKEKQNMKIKLLSILIMAIGFGACSTPYSALKDISSFEELDYKYPVKKGY